MVINNEKNLKKLFYDFYCDILRLYNNKKPKHYLSDVGNFESQKNGYSISTNKKIRLCSCSYYFENKNKIRELTSFKKIVYYIRNSLEILESDLICSDSPDKKNIGKKFYKVVGIEESFGASIYSVATKIFETYNKSIIDINWDLKPAEINKINLDESALLFELKNKHSFSPTDKYYYYMQNFAIDKSFFNLKLDKKIIQLKKLSDKEKTLLINVSHFGSENLIVDIGTIDVAIISKVRLNDIEIKNILTLLRLFSAGEFRLYAIGESKKGFDNKETLIRLNTFANIVEKPLIEKCFSLHREYHLNQKETRAVKKFFKDNYSKISNFEFANECLNLLHSLDDKYKMPYIFFILESFFEKIKSENTYRLSYSMSKILKKSFDFSKTIRDLYDLRGDVVHGNGQIKLDKKSSKIKNEGRPFNNMKECVDFLEDTMRQLWKEILKKDLYKKRDIEESIF